MADKPSGSYGSALGSYGPPGGSFGRLAPPEPQRRGGQRRRRDNNSQVIHTFTPYFDGRLWRKYGQKKIKYAPYPRLYFRCSYREDRHCMASKLLQQVNDDDPPLYEVTYMYEHTCKAPHIPPPDVVDTTEPPDGSDGFVLSFGSSCGGERSHSLPVPVPPSPLPTTMGFGSYSNSQLHENPDFFHVNVPPAAVAWSPAESWPSTTSGDECDLFSVWDSFGGLGFDDHVPHPAESMFIDPLLN